MKKFLGLVIVGLAIAIQVGIHSEAKPTVSSPTKHGEWKDFSEDYGIRDRQ